jgi:hypothetical protein
MVTLHFEVNGQGLFKEAGLLDRVSVGIVYSHNMPPADKPQFKNCELSIIFDWKEG